MNQPDCKIASIKDLENLPQWLVAKAKHYKLKYLLAHAEDGVIWGRFDEESLITADQVFTDLSQKLPTLRLSTLQRCRAFSQAGELLLWKSRSDWKYCFTGNLDGDYISEKQMLWGTQKVEEVEEKDGFTLVKDGSEGLRHAVPCVDIPFSNDRKKLKRPLRLEVHHYIDYDEDGLARINRSRLVDLTTV
ncbi:crispr-associated tigr03984 family [Leptolyngbya sp. Heron Island J]|uniref:type III-D CRISPR-associated protein Csx19 n=1 Tax=Leptolyngbya sp. Heron Island J TaxID=1385935 RepID=UPI0003B99D71|nr:CRISPR-associated protein Csx19 [Leptolyngbya sp. Heron Island J]ESA32292.1 crispr-associated tigr03984 family [Leptolyngbya sp. Heron Island J]